MRIALTTLKVTESGGISRYVVELARRYVRGHDVHIITSKMDYDIEGVIIHKQGIIWKPISVQIITSTLAYTKTLNNLKKNGEIDLIHGQGAEVLSPDVVTAHSCQKAAVEQFKKERGVWYRLMKPLEPRNRVVLAIEKHNLGGRRFRKVIAVSKNVKDDLIKHYHVPEEDIVVVYNGVNIKDFNPDKKATDRSTIRKQLGVGLDDTAAIFSGWEFKRKGLMQIIRALPHIKGLKLIIVGGDNPTDYQIEAQKLGVTDRIFFTGKVDDISRYYASTDFLIFPTAYEPFGLVITEAMASGIPVITSKCAGAAEVITDGQDGLLLDNPHSFEEIAEKTNYLMENSLIETMGAKARKTAEKYSWDNVAEQTLKVYGEALE